MKKTINFYDFERAFVKMNAENEFTHEGKKALFEYFEQYEASTGYEIELDVIALCCEYTEYDNISDFHCKYDHEKYPDVDSLYDYTQVIQFGDDSFIIQNF